MKRESTRHTRCSTVSTWQTTVPCFNTGGTKRIACCWRTLCWSHWFACALVAVMNGLHGHFVSAWFEDNAWISCISSKRICVVTVMNICMYKCSFTCYVQWVELVKLLQMLREMHCVKLMCVWEHKQVLWQHIFFLGIYYILISHKVLERSMAHRTWQTCLRELHDIVWLTPMVAGLTAMNVRRADHWRKYALIKITANCAWWNIWCTFTKHR